MTLVKIGMHSKLVPFACVRSWYHWHAFEASAFGMHLKLVPLACIQSWYHWHAFEASAFGMHLKLVPWACIRSWCQWFAFLLIPLSLSLSLSLEYIRLATFCIVTQKKISTELCHDMIWLVNHIFFKLHFKPFPSYIILSF